LDRMAIGSDIMSTHYVKRTGASLLSQWGLLEKIKQLGTPAIERLSFKIDDILLSGVAPPYEGVGADYTPRRIYLEKCSWTPQLRRARKFAIVSRCGLSHSTTAA